MKPISSRRTLPCWFSALFAAGLLTGVPVEARAQPSASDMAQARELLNEGLDLREKGDASGALAKLQGAHALANTPITGLELGRTYVTLGKWVEARETFLSIARIPPRPDETSRSKTARSESERLADQLRGRIPTLSVKITGVPVETVSVAIDGATVPTAALVAPRLLNPGTHTVFARSTTGGTAETHLELKEGETRDVELKLTFSPSAAAQPSAAPAPAGSGVSEPAFSPLHGSDTPAQPSSSPSHVVEWSLIGGGAALAIAGVVLMGVEANQAQSSIANLDRSSFDGAKTGWTVGLVGTIVGGVALGTGAIVLLGNQGHAHSASNSPSLWLQAGATDLRLRGTW